MEVVLLVVHLLIALALIGIVLLQPSEGGALGVGQGPGGLSGMMQGRSQASSLTRATVWLGVAFFTTSIALTLLAKSNRPEIAISPGSAPASAPSAPLSSVPIPEGGLLAPSPSATPAPAASAPAPSSPAPGTANPAALAPAPAAPPSAAPAQPAPAQPAPAGPAQPAPANP